MNRGTAGVDGIKYYSEVSADPFDREDFKESSNSIKVVSKICIMFAALHIVDAIVSG